MRPKRKDCLQYRLWDCILKVKIQERQKETKKLQKKKKQGEGGKIYKENCIIKSGETQILNSKEHSKQMTNTIKYIESGKSQQRTF